MKRGVKCLCEGGMHARNVFCVVPQSVRNKRNINNLSYKTYIYQLVKRSNLFRYGWNTLEQTGTNLFRHVPAMFRFCTFQENRCSPSAPWPAEQHEKNVFRFVPVPPEHFQIAGGPVIRGFQRIAKKMFRLFRMFSGGTQVSVSRRPQGLTEMEISQ